MKSPYPSERELYTPVVAWLNNFLTSRFRKAQVQVYDAHAVDLSALIESHKLDAGLTPDWPTWEIQIDVVGFVREANVTRVAFVECKNVPLTLDHLAQLLGYSRIARPQYAFLVSPQGPKRSLTQLLKTYQRLDVLEYHQEAGKLPRSMMVAQWDANANAIAFDSIITSDSQKVELGRF